MQALSFRCLGTLCLGLSAASLQAGGSGLNVAVVVNQNSTNSVQLGNYYCEQRQVPPQNLLRINWSGGNVAWSKSDFEAYLLNPLVAMLSSRQLTTQVEHVVLSMDLPYRVYNGGIPTVSGTNSTTSALFYGFKPDGLGFLPASCSLPAASSNSYAGSEGIFRGTAPTSANSNSWLVMMLTSSNLAQAKAVVDRGLASDSAFPAQTVYLIHYDFDPIRGMRHVLYDDTIFDNRVRGVERVVRTNTYSPSAVGYQLGSQFGLVNPGSLPANLFAPGSLADNLTSYGGQIFENSGHMGPLHYLNAGATASYGTVVEPCAYFEKFPSPRNYFLQARGFSAAECYYMSVTNPYQGLLVGEPLAAPFAVPCSAAWSNPPGDAVLSGTTNLSVQLTAADSSRPVQQVDLFLDGTFVQTLTNITPRQNNRLHVTLNSHAMSYSVPAGATIKSVAAGLTTELNKTANTNATKVLAFARGDRIELRSLNLAKPGADVSTVVSNSIGTASALTTIITATRTNFLDTTTRGIRNCVVTNAAQNGSYLQLTVTKTNASSVTLSVTNTPGNTNTPTLIQALINAINTNATLVAADGLLVEDSVNYQIWGTPPINGGEFILYARSGGWPESQIQMNLSGSANFGIAPTGNAKLDENLGDLQPRNHLYISAGVTNLNLTFPFNTTSRPDGYHELTAVAYEGSHVRTQKRISQNVRIQNTPLSATFTCSPCGSNTAVEATVQFFVTANTNTISKIELFSTGGSLASVSSQASAMFSVAGTNLGIGLHPFHAVVTRNDGKQYRTETKWIRLIGAEPPFALRLTTPPPTLSWPATAGRNYAVLSATNVANPFQVRATLMPTNSAGQWVDTNAATPRSFYRVRTSP